MKFRKITAIALIFCLLIPLFATANTVQDAEVGQDCHTLNTNTSPPVWFFDVTIAHWAYDHIHYAARNGFMHGVTANHFAPDDTMTRAMFVQMLYNREGRPPVDLERLRGRFVDVPAGAWFEEAVLWSFDGSLTNGVNVTHFDPHGTINRAMLATLLRNYTRFSNQYEPVPVGIDPLVHFNDAADIPVWAWDAMAWAVYHGYMSGVGGNFLAPAATATRAEAAAILVNVFGEEPALRWRSSCSIGWVWSLDGIDGTYEPFRVFRSIAEIDKFIDQLHHDWRTAHAIENFRAATARFTDSFFEHSYLVIVWRAEPSGSIRPTVAQVDEDGTIILHRAIPVWLTADMAYWTFFIELDNDFQPDSFRLEIISDYLSFEFCDN